MNPSLVDYERRYQQAPCGYLVTEDSGTIVDVNETFLDWAGYSRPALIGTRIQRLLPVGDQLLYTTYAIPQLRLSGSVSEVSLEIVAADSTRQAALLTASRTITSAGETEVLVVIFGAHKRRKYELELVAARRAAEESEARRAHAEADLQHLALHDHLTGLANRAALITTLQEKFASNPDIGPGLCLLFIDLDHFKAVNDSLGHRAGDELLTSVAQRLNSIARSTSTVARLAGDEFVILEHVSTLHQASALANRVIESLTAPVTIEGLEVVCSTSVGVALSGPGCDTAELLLRQADIAMYRAKAAGRGRWELHDPSTIDPAVNRLHLLGELRHAITHRQLRLHYQPRVNLHTEQIDGVEALVRWEHPQRGLLYPGAFIDLAEASGLIRDLGLWVLNEAVSQAAQWTQQATTVTALQMAVNLSTRQLMDPHLVAHVEEILTRNALDPRLLTLEITETALMDNPDMALTALTSLKALGVNLAIDDFGTGYASLTYLKNFPIDELKIDRSFINGVATDIGDAAIVASCVQLAHAVGIRAVAEGVETDQQRTVLLDLDCDLAQGFHYSRPQPPEVLTAWLTAQRTQPITSTADPCGLARHG